MRTPARSGPGRVTAAFTLAAAVMTAGGAAAPAAIAAPAAAAAPGVTAAAPEPGAAVVHAVSPAAQAAAARFWTPQRMAAARPAPRPASGPGSGTGRGASAGPPPGTPYPTVFTGVPTVGALFFTTGAQQHFCTASVVHSRTQNLVLTAAHCVYGSTYASHIEFVPRYHYGKKPYGAWPVRAITVAIGWQRSHDQNLDFAFLAVAPPAGTRRPIQSVTGSLRLGINQGFAHAIEVIGYNNTGNTAIKCATHSFRFTPHQMKFFCHDYQDGTSGGPWILGFNPATGTGTVFGVIGGYQRGGDYDWASYSAYFGLPALRLFRQAGG